MGRRYRSIGGSWPWTEGQCSRLASGGAQATAYGQPVGQAVCMLTRRYLCRWPSPRKVHNVARRPPAPPAAPGSSAPLTGSRRAWPPVPRWTAGGWGGVGWGEGMRGWGEGVGLGPCACSQEWSGGRRSALCRSPAVFVTLGKSGISAAWGRHRRPGAQKLASWHVQISACLP